MIKLAIRDDDMNYFTKVEDVEFIYRDIADFPVSFAVIPNVLDVSTKGACPETNGNTVPQWIGNNHELVSWVKGRLCNGTIDVLLHGNYHSYKIINGKRFAEMQWRDETNLKEEIRRWRNSLEELFGYSISVFVAPSNKVSRYGIQCIADNGMHYSGIVPIQFQRAATLRNLGNYAKRWYFRIKDQLPYPNVLEYSDHKELNACLMQGYKYLVQMFHYCQRINSPMAVNVHYWHLRDNIKERKQLVDFVKYALDNGAIPATLSELLK